MIEVTKWNRLKIYDFIKKKKIDLQMFSTKDL